MRITPAEFPDRQRMTRRRRVFFTLVFLLTSLGSWLMADLLWNDDQRFTFTDGALLALFIVLFAQISTGFIIAMLGLLTMCRRHGDSSRILATLAPGEEPRLAGTAIVMPVFNEDVSRVFEGLRVIFRSIKETGKLEHFDFFILSDSNQPNQWIQEEVAWVELCKQEGGFGKIFYRKRRQQINKKAGNVADFLRRWGRSYRYMTVLDADSIMTGEALVRLVALMEKNPSAGIIQTAPRLVNGETLYSRLQQFANRLYSPLFLAGLNYWQQDTGNYWGHNAIIRVQPFIDHCALPELPGSEPFGGRILSHDFIEAALMRKAGWSVWLAGGIEGTYEEGPPTLIDSAKRDRRWCQGNMQHSWLLLAKGFRPCNRLHLLMGVMAYVSSPLWLLFLLFSTWHIHELITDGMTGSRAMTTVELFGRALRVPDAVTLFALTLLLLFLPKFISLSQALRHGGQAARFGGRARLLASTLLEIVLSALLAPVNMLFNSKFVATTLLGQGVSWITQRRGAGEDDGTDWREAILTHYPHMLIGLAWGAGAWLLSPILYWWLSPVLAGMVFSIPLSILLGKLNLGRAAQKAGLFLTPEETRPPLELARLRSNLETCYKHMRPLETLRADYGLLQAVLDPYVNAVHVSMLRQRTPGEEARDYFAHLRERLLREGPDALQPKEKLSLLLDAESMIWLHRELWRTPAAALAEWWRLAVRQYNVLTAAPITALYR
ncbi:MAG: glucans biosynthesis glucosyltransferase MdoH [Opitutaceae bacterium]|jgi:membrane glycosyltransferase|nr:glucans biosynthesis glucosyltransferase MdoH [Opitutaceae bacterium]